MLNNRLELLNDYPFAKLADLIAGITPRANQPPLVMSVGEPQHHPPAFVREIIDRHADTWHRYPPIQGTPEFRTACVAWLTRRYKLPAGALDPDTQIAPVAGTREGLFLAPLLAVSRAEPGAPPPVALIPNPFYQVYFGAAVMSGAEVALMSATRETGFLPDLAAIDEATLARAQIMYLCSPGNPQGAVASGDYLKQAIAAARRHNFLLVVDECYAEIYTGPAPPAGALEAAAALSGDGRGLNLDNLLVFHTLSKRSSAPGLRAGFAVGSPRTIERFNRLRSYSCAATPLALMEAATALWRDEAHVEDIRALYRAKFDIAERLFGDRFGFYRPAGGFFLWLDVGDGEAAAKKLWAEAGIKVLPGAYCTRPDRNGVNTGKPYIRVALVHDLDTTEAALTRFTQVLQAATNRRHLDEDTRSE